MRIAITSQNRKTVTGHAGKCRKFWVYEIEGSEIKGRNLLELSIEQSFHESHGDEPHPLDGVNVLITGGMGFGLQQRLKQKGILAVATSETDLERAVTYWLAGTLPEAAPDAHDHEHGHEQGHDHGRQAIAFVDLKTLS